MTIQKYLESIAQINNLTKSDFNEWLFYPGMLFNSYAKWWGDWGNRITPHEGIDIVFYRNLLDDSNVRTLSRYDLCSNSKCDFREFDSNIMVPAMAKGTIVNICDDFLGYSIIIEHGRCNIKNSIITTIYSHLSFNYLFTNNHLKSGMAVSERQIIGNVADTSLKKSGIPPHLHISIAEISSNIPPNELNWNMLANPNNSPDKVKFFNPVH